MGPRPGRIIFLVSLAAVVASGADRRRSFAELAAEADKVVIGTVSGRSSSWGDADHIYTDVLITPDVTIKGSDEGPVAIRVLGGRVGDTVMSVSDGPEFPDGERLVVFLKREGSRFAVDGRAAGSVRAASAEGAAAAESAFAAVEKTAGRRLVYQRGLAARYLGSMEARAQTGCYGTDGAKWAADSAAYRLGTTIPAEWPDSIDAAASTWSGAGAAFRLLRDDASSNELSFEDLVAKYGGSYSDTLAVTTTWSSGNGGTISKATVAFNTKFGWSTAGESDKADVQNIITHEFGHWMRLLDIYAPSTCSDVTMWGSAPNGETKKRTLEQADIDGLLSLYPASATAIAAPVLVFPGNGATGVALGFKFKWNASPNATSYDLYFGTSLSPGFAGTVGFTDFQTGPLPAGTYYWRVVAKNASGSAASDMWSFTIGAGTAPSGTALPGPVLVFPGNGATVALGFKFKWNASPNATSYDVYFGASTTPGFAGTVGFTDFQTGPLPVGTKFYWRVVAKTASGTASSEMWTFTVGSATPTSTGIAGPVLVFPGNAATVVATAFKLTWTASPGATSYDLYCGTSPSPAFAGTVGFTDFQTGGLPAGTKFYWRVVAKNATGSASSDTWSFTIGSETSVTRPGRTGRPNPVHPRAP